MAEYIERGTAIKRVMETKWESGSDGAAAMEIVAAAPSDVEPVVRCKDCQFWGRYTGQWENHDAGACKYRKADYGTGPDGFCSDGVRKMAGREAGTTKT